MQVETMQLIPGVEVTAVAAGSSKEKAEGFAEEHGEHSAENSTSINTACLGILPFR